MIGLDTERPSTADLLSDAFSKTSRLLGSELQLVRIELGEKVSQAIKAIVAIVVAAVFLIVAMVFLLQAAVAALVAHGVSPMVANLGVGSAVAVLCVIAILSALSGLSASKLQPKKTMRQLHADAGLVTGEK